jgi:ferritin-like metal-binding protein YciE
MAKTATKSAAKKKAVPESSSSKASSAKEVEPKLKELFVDSLKDIYWAEKKLVSSLPKLQKAATTRQLKDAIGEHITVTKGQVARLEEVFGILGKKAQGKKCEAMEGLVKEAESVVEDTDAGSATRDAGIIMAAQKTEHYEIATYGSLVTLAGVLGHENIAAILQETLDEEKDADTALTGIAENDINYQAATETE